MKRILTALLGRREAVWFERGEHPGSEAFLSDGFSLQGTEGKKRWDQPKKKESQKVSAYMLCFCTGISKVVLCRSAPCRFQLSQRIICPRGFIIRHSWGRNWTQVFLDSILINLSEEQTVSQYLGHSRTVRDSLGFLCRKWEGGEEEGAVKCSLVLYTVSLMYVQTGTPSCLCRRTQACRHLEHLLVPALWHLRFTQEWGF